MSEPTILRDALLDHQILSQLPGLASHLERPTPTAATPTGTRFLDDLREHAAAASRPDPDPTTATGTQEAPVSHTPHDEQLLVTNTDTDHHDMRRQQQVEAEPTTSVGEPCSRRPDAPRKPSGRPATTPISSSRPGR